MNKPNYSPEAKARRLAYSRKWAAEHPGYAKEKWAKYSQEKKEELKQKRAAHYVANPEKRRAAARAFTWKRKLKMIKAYGGKCICCGEAQPKFLTIDHVRGGGLKHVKSVDKGR